MEGDVADESFNVGGLLGSLPQLIAIANPNQALPIAREARDYLHVLLSTVPTTDTLASVSDIAGTDVAAACACVLVDSSLADDVIRSDAGTRGALDALKLPHDRLVEQLRASVQIDTDAVRRALHVVAAAAITGPATGAVDTTIALEAIASVPAGQSDRKLADALLQEARGNGVDTSRLEEAGVALVGLIHRPTERPAEIGGAAARDVDDAQWLNDASRSAYAAPSEVGNSLIIGELMTLTRLAWERPTIRREQAAAFAGTDDQTAAPFAIDLPMLHYHRVADGGEIAEELAGAIIFNFAEPGDDPWSSRGVALSPCLWLLV